NRDGVGIDVGASHRIERFARRLVHVHPRLGCQAVIEQPLERTQQEVPAAAGRIDERGLVETKALNRWLERLVENEALYEARGLQERVTLAHVLAEVLVQVSQE